MKQPKEYKKLASHRYFLGRGAKLHLAKDHLLFSESMGYSEDYKRFYFRDIQAVLVRPFPQRMLWNFFWGGMALLFFILMMVAIAPSLGGVHKKPSEDTLFWIGSDAILSACFFLPFLINNFMGTGCRCHLKTAIQTVQLPIVRRRKVEKILALLTPLITAAQQNMTEAPALVPSVPEGFTAPAVPQLTKPFRPHAHWALFSVLPLYALVVISRFYWQNLPVYFAEVILNLLSIGSVIIALVWQSRGGASPILRRITTAALVCVIVNYLIEIAWGSVAFLQHPQFAADHWAMIQWASSQSPERSVFSMVVAVYEIVFASLLGVIGLIELSLNRSKNK